ncbi:MAG: hypothetical protein AAF626_02325 [Pseudomonadota bacterium]
MTQILVWLGAAISFAALMGATDACPSVACLPDDGPWSAADPNRDMPQASVQITPEEALAIDRKLTALIGATASDQ